MNRRLATGALVILLVFATGLVGYFRWSADRPDGLEATLERAGVEEAEAAYEAPLDYGDRYGTALAAGITGFALVFAALTLLGAALVRHDAEKT